MVPRRDSASVVEGEVPEHYRVQVQHQLMVSGAQTAHLWVFDGERGLLHRMERDESLMERIQIAWDDFQRYLDGDKAPPLSPRDTLIRADEAWQLAAKAFVQKKEEADAAACRLSPRGCKKRPGCLGATSERARVWRGRYPLLDARGRRLQENSCTERPGHRQVPRQGTRRSARNPRRAVLKAATNCNQTATRTPRSGQKDKRVSRN